MQAEMTPPSSKAASPTINPDMLTGSGSSSPPVAKLEDDPNTTSLSTSIDSLPEQVTPTQQDTDETSPTSKTAAGKKQSAKQNGPPLKPHVCDTCQRAFARLEHLKRHERSHTKEKPFQCSECARCFSRRDLLLRHQQKLHNMQNPAQRARQQRRGSVNVSSVPNSAAPSNNRVRKGSNTSTTGALANAMAARPRANTIGHLDFANLMLTENQNLAQYQPVFPSDLAQRHEDLAQRHRLSESALPMAAASMQQALQASNLPKLRTQSYDHNYSNHTTPRTAPPTITMFQCMPRFGIPVQVPPTPQTANTVNPAELHFPQSYDSPITPVDDMPFTIAPPAPVEMNWDHVWNANDPINTVGDAIHADLATTAFEMEPANWSMDNNYQTGNGAMAIFQQQALNNSDPCSNMTSLLESMVAPQQQTMLQHSGLSHLAGMSNSPMAVPQQLPSITPQQQQQRQQQQLQLQPSQPPQEMFGMMPNKLYLSPSSMSNTSSADTSGSSSMSMTDSTRNSSLSMSSYTDAASRQLMEVLNQPIDFSATPAM